MPGLLDLLRKPTPTTTERKRHALFVEAQQLMYDSAWFGYMWFENGNFLVHKRVQSFPESTRSGAPSAKRSGGSTSNAADQPRPARQPARARTHKRRATINTKDRI